MNPEVTITIKISVNKEGEISTAVQAEGDASVIPENVSPSGETAVINLPPPPELEAQAFESMAAVELPPVPEIEPDLERAALESQIIPDLPPVPDV